MQKIEGATDADYFVIGIIVGSLAVRDSELRLVIIERSNDKVVYRIQLKVGVRYALVSLARELLKDYFGETNWGLHSPNDFWICVYRPLTNIKVGGAQ